MVRRVHLRLWFLVALLLGQMQVWAAFSDVYVFGDSLSDNGTLPDIVGINYQFPYSSVPGEDINRVSNGPLAVEGLTGLLGLPPLQPALFLSDFPAAGTNYAVAGARAGRGGIGNLGSQILAFQANHLGGASATALYTVFVAGNDVLDLKDQTDDAQAAATIQKATQAVGSALDTLINAGAQSILVPNVFDIGLTPVAAGNPTLATKRTTEYNTALSATLADVESRRGIDLFEYDLFVLSQRIVADPALFGLTNITEPCTDGFVLAPSFVGDCDASVIDEYAFIDDIHPTASVHDLIGREFYLTVIPVPAALPLFGSALVLLGVRAWRRR